MSKGANKMDLVTSRQAEKITGVTAQTLVKWAEAGIVPVYGESRLYPVAYLQRLVYFSGVRRPSRERAEFCMLEWRASQGTDKERREVRSEVRELVNTGRLLTTNKTAQLVGYSSTAVRDWAVSGFLACIQIDHQKLFFAIDVDRTKSVLGGLTMGEVADRLGVSQTWVAKLVKNDKLAPDRTPVGFRFKPEDVEQLIASRAIADAKKAALGWTSSTARATLGVSDNTFETWAKKGLLQYVMCEGVRIFKTESILEVRRQREMLRGDFDWLVSWSAKNQKISTKQAARKLGIAAKTLSEWAAAGLLPFYNLTPRAPRGGDLLFDAAYIDKLVEYARTVRVARQTAVEFKQVMRASQK